jgi:HK97 gp10 family phage protein
MTSISPPGWQARAANFFGLRSSSMGVLNLGVGPAAAPVATSVCSAKHGALLEFGTQRIRPRPFFRPAYTNTKAAAQAAIENEVRKALA